MRSSLAILLALVCVGGIACIAPVDGGADLSGEDDPGDPNVADDPNADPGEGDERTGETVQAATSSGMIDAQEAAFLNEINAYRKANGKPALRVSVALSRAAHSHSADMAAKNYFSHNSLDGTDPFTRMKRAGYTYSTAMSENIAAGNSDARPTFIQWRDSDGHRKNMLGDYTVIGIGRAYSSTSTYKWYWTTNFGGYTDAVFSYGTGTLLRNGGFESAPAGTATWSSVRTRGNWYVSNATRATASPAAGSYQMTVKDPDPGAASVTQIVLGAPGVGYTFSGVSKRVAGSTAQYLYLEFLKSDYTRIAVYRVTTNATSTYANAAVSRIAPAGTKYVRAFVYGTGAAGTRSSFQYDSMRLLAQ